MPSRWSTGDAASRLFPPSASPVVKPSLALDPPPINRFPPLIPSSPPPSPSSASSLHISPSSPISPNSIDFPHLAISNVVMALPTHHKSRPVVVNPEALKLLKSLGYTVENNLNPFFTSSTSTVFSSSSTQAPILPSPPTQPSFTFNSFSKLLFPQTSYPIQSQTTQIPTPPFVSSTLAQTPVIPISNLILGELLLSKPLPPPHPYLNHNCPLPPRFPITFLPMLLSFHGLKASKELLVRSLIG